MAKQQGNRRTFKELCADYVLNILDQEERMRFEEMLDEATEEERKLYQQMRTKGNDLLFSDRDDPSPEELREELLEEVNDLNKKEENQTSEHPKVRAEEDVITESTDKEEPHVSLTLVISVVLGFICLSLVFYAFSLRSEISDQEHTIAEQEEKITTLENEIKELQQMLTVIDSRQLHVVRLLGMEANPFGYGNVIWDSQNNRVIAQFAELPDAGENEQYQFWAIFDNRALDLRSFSVDKNGNALLLINNLEDLDNSKGISFAVTLEAEGTSSQPDGEMHLMGSFDEQ